MKTINVIPKGTGASQQNVNMPRPEIRDNLDSRKNEEYDYQGDNITHTKKAHHNQPKGKNQYKKLNNF